VTFPRPRLSACFVWGELQPAAGGSRRDELEPVCGRQERLVHGFSLFGTQGMARRAPVGEVVEILVHLKTRLGGSALLQKTDACHVVARFGRWMKVLGRK
jgi:hypothetical protein